MRLEVSMNKFHKCLKFLYVLVISSLMLLAGAVPGLASDGDGAVISLDFDFTPIILTAVFVIVLFFVLIALIYFLSRHISESKNRISRLSKIEAEETVQLYDDLEDAKWSEETESDEKSRDVLLDDEYKRNASMNRSAADPSEEPHHGPVPERDMPGYDPHAGEEDGELKPLTPMPTPPSQHMPSQQPSFAPSAPMQAGMYQSVPVYPYAPAQMQPRVYRPDSDVEIIMRDSTSEPAVTYTHAPSGVTAPRRPKVRAYRRRGIPPVYNAHAYTDPVSEELITSAERMPRFNMSHLSIGPLGNAGSADPAPETPANYTLELNAPEVAPIAEPEPILEAPILDPNADANAEAPKADEPDVTVIRESVDYEEAATVNIDPPRRGVNEKILVKLGDDLENENLMRTLDDVLDDLDDEIPVVELDIQPVYEEELIFLADGELASDDAPVDEIFDDEEGTARMFIDGKYTIVRYRTSFMSRFIQSEERIQDYYAVIKNLLLSFDGVNSEIAWSCETFTKDDKACAKVNIKDKTLMLYLALDPERYRDSKYHYTYVYDKYAKYKDSKPAMMIKIKNDRALKHAIALIYDMMEELNISGGDVKDVDYRHAYETTEQLIARGLIKILPADTNEAEEASEAQIDVADIIEHSTEAIAVELDGSTVFDFDEEAVEEPVEEPAEEPVEEPVEETEQDPEPVPPIITDHEIIHADADEVDELLTDEEAIESIEIVEDKAHTHTGKMCEVNLDSICEKFEDGETVTLDELKARHLVSRSAVRVKILARGIMTKTLTVYADKFSLQAVKMITLAGGHAEQYK